MKEGYAEHFVGRRREQQRLLPKLRSGDLQVVIITGLGGSGKSTLATRLARRLETHGFIPIPVPSSRENPLNSARLLQAFGDAFRNAARKHKSQGNTQKADELAALAEDLNNPKLSVKSRLHDAVAALNEGRFLLLLDNFESNLDEADRHILDTEISGFYRYLLESLSGGSRAIVTTRYPPSDVPVLPPKVHREDLGDFPESSFLKIMQRDPEVERRSRSGELPMALLRELYKKFGGTPRFLLQIREAIKEMDAELLKTELARVELPADTEPGELQKLQGQILWRHLHRAALWLPQSRVAKGSLPLGSLRCPCNPGGPGSRRRGASGRRTSFRPKLAGPGLCLPGDRKIQGTSLDRLRSAAGLAPGQAFSRRAKGCPQGSRRFPGRDGPARPEERAWALLGGLFDGSAVPVLAGEGA